MALLGSVTAMFSTSSMATMGSAILFVVIVTFYGYIQAKADAGRRKRRLEAADDASCTVGLRTEAQFRAIESQVAAYVETLRASLANASKQAAVAEERYDKLTTFTSTGVLRYNRDLILKEINLAATTMLHEVSTFLQRATIRATGESLKEKLPSITDVETMQLLLEDRILEMLVYPTRTMDPPKVASYILYLNDVTERVQAAESLEEANLELRRLIAESTRELRLSQDELRRSRDLYQRMYADAPVGMYRTAVEDGTFLDANDSMARILGYASVDELMQHRSTDHFLNPGDRDALVRSEAGRYGTSPHVYNLEMTTADGSLVILQFHEIAVMDKGYYEGACIDVTNQVLSERRELSTRMLYQTTLDAIMDGVMTYDIRSDVPVVSYQNRRAVEMLRDVGLNPPGVNESCRNCGGTSCSKIICDAVHKAAADKTPVTDLLKMHNESTKINQVYAVMALPVRGPLKLSVTHVVCILRDLTAYASGSAALEQELRAVRAVYETIQHPGSDNDGTLSDNLTAAFARLQSTHAQAIIRNTELETVLNALPDSLFLVDLDIHAAVAYGVQTGKETGAAVTRLAVVYGQEAENTIMETAETVLVEHRTATLLLPSGTSVYQVRVVPLPQKVRQALVLFRDVTEWNTYERLLLSIADLIEALCREATPLTLPELEVQLAELGRLVKVDRVYVMTNRFVDGEPETYTQVAEWCAPGVPSQRSCPYLTDMPYDKNPDHGVMYAFWRSMMNGQTFNSSEYEVDACCAVQLAEQSISALLIAPLMWEGCCLGFIGFDLCGEPREWTRKDEVVLRAYAAVLAHSAWLERLVTAPK